MSEVVGRLASPALSARRRWANALDRLLTRPGVDGASQRARRVDLARVALLCRGDFVSLGLVLTWIAWVEWPLLVGEAVYARSDTFAFFFPVFAELYRAVTAGRLPMWSGDLQRFPLAGGGADRRPVSAASARGAAGANRGPRVLVSPGRSRRAGGSGRVRAVPCVGFRSIRRVRWLARLFAG